MSVSLIKKTATLFAVIVLIALAAIAMRWAAGDVAAYPARQSIEHWQKQNRMPNQTELQAALKAANNALEWQANNGEYLDLQALLFYYSALTALQNNQLEQFNSYTRQALNTYRLSTQVRPQWPYSWANLALMKAKLAEFDTEYKQALENAIKYGPWENAVNIAVSEAGMIGWQQLPKYLQTNVIENIQRGLQRNSKQIKQTLSGINRLKLVCIHIPPSQQRKQLCGY